MKKNVIIVSGILILGLVLSLYLGDTLSRNSQVNQTANPTSTNANTQKSIPTQTTSQNPQDVIPGLYPDPIKDQSTKEGFKITSIIVENNTGSSGNPVSDHLQLTLQNLTNTDLSNFEVYYTITDPATNKKEGYYKKLDNFTLKGNSTQTIHFDNQQGLNHFSVNTHSLYYTSSDSLKFTVEVSTPNYKLETVSATKAAGGAETKD